MRARFLPAGLALALAVGLLSALPAAADYAVSIEFPGGGSEFYSPFDGPATVTFTFSPGVEEDTTFVVRLRRDGDVVHKDTVFVDGDDADGTREFDFTWPALSVSTDRAYEVAVFLDGAKVASEFFQMKPRLVSIASIKPNPFFPWIDDDHKDETTVKFNLEASSQPTTVHVYRAKPNGKCCGVKVRFEDLGTKVPGTVPETWKWDGRKNSGDMAEKGDYFVKIRAEDPANVVGWSKPSKVEIARSYRVLAKRQKYGIAYHHSGPVTVYRRGGNCFVTKDETDKDLWITCLSASFTVYWRWSLPSGGRIKKESFVYVKVSGEICNGKKDHTKRDSYLKVGGVGQFRCRVDLAKITYSYLKQS